MVPVPVKERAGWPSGQGGQAGDRLLGERGADDLAVVDEQVANHRAVGSLPVVGRCRPITATMTAQAASTMATAVIAWRRPAGNVAAPAPCWPAATMVPSAATPRVPPIWRNVL